MRYLYLFGFFQQFGNFNIGNLQMSFGIGAFPFSIFATTFNHGNAARPGNRKSLVIVSVSQLVICL